MFEQPSYIPKNSASPVILLEYASASCSIGACAKSQFLWFLWALATQQGLRAIIPDLNDMQYR